MRSANSDRTLTFSDVRGDYFTVAIEGNACSASLPVWGYPDTPRLVALFDSLADWKGWLGERSWQSLEGELALHATTDRLGHIELRIVLSALGTATDPWQLEAIMALEAAQLAGIARDVTRVFQKAS